MINCLEKILHKVAPFMVVIHEDELSEIKRGVNAVNKLNKINKIIADDINIIDDKLKLKLIYNITEED